MRKKVFLDPGALSTQLVLETCTPEPDGLGGHTEAWEPVATLFARLEMVSATSRFGADQTMETLTHRIIIRHRAGVLAGMRFTTTGRVLEVVTVHDPDGTARYLVCGTREVTT